MSQNQNQITIEEMQKIIGKLTMNYELQIERMVVEMTRLSEVAQKLNKDKNGNTALINIAKLDRIANTEYLLENGADVNAKNKKGETLKSMETT